MVSSLKKVLGIGKDNFYRELDESQEQEAAAQQPDSKATEAVTEAAASTAEAVTEAAASTAKAVTEAAASTAEAVTEAAASTAAAVTPEAEAQPKASKSKKSKASKKKSAKKQAPVEAKASAPQSADPAAIAASAVNGSKAPSSVADDKTFAPNYLMPVPTKSRRRPGPSLKMFQEMARQVTPRKG
ncbi:MAG: hypothetical protein SVX43_08200 [Cyanobacteriota bacterium]|nr:hypothetical protein [Cyanobacteriota bacterium]